MAMWWTDNRFNHISNHSNYRRVNMIEKIKEVIRLQEELENEHGIISIEKSMVTKSKRVKYRNEANIHELKDFLKLSAGHDVLYAPRKNYDYYPHKLYFEAEDVHFYMILTDEKYEEYKKAVAPTTTKEKIN